jgi:hypothetical protein
MRYQYLLILLSFCKIGSAQGQVNDTITEKRQAKYVFSVDRQLSTLIFHKKRKKEKLNDQWWRVGLLFEFDPTIASTGFFSLFPARGSQVENQLYVLLGTEKLWKPIKGLDAFQFLTGVDVLPGVMIRKTNFSSYSSTQQRISAKSLLFAGVRVDVFKHINIQLETGFSCDYAFLESELVQGSYHGNISTHFFQLNYLPIRAIRMGVTF